MIRSPLTLMTAAALALLGPLAVSAQDDEALQRAIDARQAHMQLYAHNLGILGGMARGNIPYDADMAAAAAADLGHLTRVSQQAYWPEGSDIMMEGSNALPAIWDNLDDVFAKSGDLVEAVAAMEAVAGDGLEAVQGRMQALGGACVACHREYQQEN